jgi:uncharacterized protein YlxW (UPF0749 family)
VGQGWQREVMEVRSSHRTAISFGVAGLILGFLMTVQLRSQHVQTLTREANRLVDASIVRQLDDEQRQLKERIAFLRGAIAEIEKAQAAVLPHTLQAELDGLRAAAGLSALQGPGVGVVVDDSSRPLTSGDDASNFLVHDYELRDVIGLLWLAGAEAIAVNGERLVGTSSVYCVGSTILVNDTRLSPPYTIQAIGDPARLEGALLNPANLQKLKNKVKTYGIQFRVTQATNLIIPAYHGNITLRYARGQGDGRPAPRLPTGGPH